MNDRLEILKEYLAKLKNCRPQFNLPELPDGDFKQKLEAISDQMTWKRWAILASVVLVIFMTSCWLIFGASSAKRAQLNADQVVYLTVKPGMSASDIGDELVQHGIIDSKFSFYWQARKTGVASNIHAGMYAMHPNMSIAEVLQILADGETAVVKVVIPEGFGVKDIAKRLADEGLVDEKAFLKQAKDYAPYDYIERKDDIKYACEGFLFPDTYELHDEPTPSSILKMMAADFDERLTPELRARAKEMNLSVHELITFASLVEKEAMYEEDRPIIAQVFWKRLRLDMPLQSDTTVQYLLNGPKEDLTIADTKIDSPYNTYLHRGLPPGPIASPGLASIKAVLYPADTDYLYFVADRQGHNHYSTNYSDHQVIVEQVR